MDHLIHHHRISACVPDHQRFSSSSNNNRRYLISSTAGGQQTELDDEFDPFEDDNIDSSTSMSSAPPQSQWFHGKLDRFVAEKRLKAAGQPGSYLVRESDRKVSGLTAAYVLSYLGHNGITNHFRITAVCGDYYIGGRKFNSLAHLIGYYTSISDLLKKERLLYPVQPPEPVSDYKYFVAIMPYTKMPDTDELSFAKGDVLLVHNELGDGWFWCSSLRTQDSGLVFASLVELLDDGQDPNEGLPYFHSNISKQEAVEKLAKMGPLSFLIRKSERSPGNYSLFFFVNSSIMRFRIEKVGALKYVMGHRIFTSLNEVVSRYRKEQIVEGYCLGDPVLKAPHQVILRTRRINLPQSNPTSTATTNINTMGTSTLGNSNADNTNNSQDVYATLRESREITKKKQTQSIFFKSYLLKKSNKSKKWKRLYFVINSKDQHLLWFENDKRTKPKGLVDLTYTYLYLVHDSLFERPFCFQLVERALPCLSTHHYLAAENEQEAQEWLKVIKPLCVPQQLKLKTPSLTNIREVRTLYVTLLDAHRLPSKLIPHPYAIFSLNQVKVCRTTIKTPPDPVWEEDFILDDIPSDVTTFNVTLYNKGKRSSTKDTEVAEFTIEFNKLKNGQEIEESYTLNGLTTPCREDWGSLRVRLRYVHEVIMPLRDYGILKDLIMNEDMEVISVLEDFCHRDRAPLAHALLRIFRYERREGTLLKAMVEREIKRETETTQLFRMNSLTTTIMDQYMRSVCGPFLQSALAESLRKVMESRKSCELNPSKLDSLAEACANAEMLLILLDDVVDCIFHSVESCPPMLRFICSVISRNVAAKWPDQPLVKSRAVGSFIFLRLICPAILSPQQFGLIENTNGPAVRPEDIPPSFMKREPFMEVVNPFIVKNKAKMIKFLDDIAMVYDCPDPEDTARGVCDRELATIHTICELHKEQIVNLSYARPTLKKLVVVTDILSKQKQRFLAEAKQSITS